jgi:hypothetical protein
MRKVMTGIRALKKNKFSDKIPPLISMVPEPPPQKKFKTIFAQNMKK